MLKRVVFVGMLISLVPSLSFAVPSLSFAQAGSTLERGEVACDSDAIRSCRKVLDQGDMVVLQCLQTNQKKLRRKVLEDNGQL
jgi:hypothetical protein